MDIKVYEDKMEKTLSNLQEEYVSIRAGRANPHILDKIQVDYYGTPSSFAERSKHFCTGSSYDSVSSHGKQV